MFILIIQLLLLTNSVRSEIVVKESGMEKASRGDVGMVLYVNVQNTGNKIYELNIKAVECFESTLESEKESDTMSLTGGYMGTLYAKSERKLTLIYPTMYLHNRKGKCTVDIFYTDQKRHTRKQQTCIKFNTMPDNGNVPAEVKDFYRNKKVRSCKTLDLDPLENCQPVDCLMKYCGHKNYFNGNCKSCQRVPICVSQKDEADVAYVPSSNRCRNLANCVSENDINLLEEGFVTNMTAKSHSNRGLLIRCNHGTLNNRTGLCHCHKGWTSLVTDMDQYLPGVSMYHMCNIRVDSWDPKYKKKIQNTLLIFAILAVFIILLALFVTFCLHALLLYCKKRDDQLALYASKTSCTSNGALCEYGDD